jgi:hypothetical protein
MTFSQFVTSFIDTSLTGLHAFKKNVTFIYPYNYFDYGYCGGQSECRREGKVKHYFVQDVFSICVYIMNCIILTELYRSVMMNLPLLHPHYTIPYPSDAGSSKVLASSSK